MTWLWDILRALLFFIDRIIYFLVDKVYALFIEIANTTIITEGVIDEFAGKIYGLLGIFMLFKVSFSILTYIVNPDEFADKNKGMSKLATNIVTSLVLLIAVPFVFSEAMELQRIILKDDIIPKIISTADVNVSSQDPGAGSKMAVITYKAFLSPAPGDTLGDIFGIDINEKDSSDNYKYDYSFIISTVVGVVLILLLVSYCFDIALRSIKLGFLRMLAPVPIIARIDPKKGNELFNKWVKNCVSTYLDLFMRLLAIFFAIFIIQVIISEGGIESNVDGNPTTASPLAIVFIILGALMFAKQLPKLISDLLGLDLKGNFSLNPLKKLEDVPLAGKPLASATRFAGRTAATVGGLLGTGIATGAGMAGSRIGHGIDNLTGNRISGARNAVTGWANGIRQNVGNGVNGFLGSHPTLQSAVDRVGRDLSSISNDAQSTVYGAIGGIPGTSGLLSRSADRYDSQIKALEEYAKFKSRLKEQADFDDVNRTISYTDASGTARTINSNTKALKQAYEDLKNSGTATADDITNARIRWEEAQKLSITVGNDQINSIKSEAARYVRSHRDVLADDASRGISYSTDENASYSDINSGVISAQNETVRIRSSEGYQTAQARKNAVPNKK